MSPTKTAFLKDKALAEHLSAVVNADWWTMATTYARAEMMGEQGITPESIRGAMRFEAILRDLSVEWPDTEAPFPGPGLNHNLDPESFQVTNP